jgi:hypothetical protein
MSIALEKIKHVLRERAVAGGHRQGPWRWISPSERRSACARCGTQLLAFKHGHSAIGTGGDTSCPCDRKGERRPWVG